MASRLLTSPIITVLAGPDKQAISVYAGAFEACSSRAIRALVSADWKGRQETPVDWSHTSVPTVLRIISYLYTRDYEVEVLENIENANGEQSQRWGEDHDMAFHHIKHDTFSQPSTATAIASSSTPTDVIQRPLTPLARILNDNIILYNRTTSYASLLTEPGQKFECNDIAGYLKAHADVYIFAKWHLISDLASFALARMGIALQFAEKKKQPEVALSVIRLVYQYTVKPEATEEPMRRILSQFLVLNLRQVQISGEFAALIEEGGDVVQDIFS